MISSVRGTVLSAAGTSVVVEVGGVGLAVTVTPQHALTLRIGSETSVHTALVVREDDLALFGFPDTEALTVFNLLRGVTGVGPKSAMGVLAAMSPAEVAAAVAEENDSAFRKVSGIGPKTAKLIVLSLAGKMQVFRATVPVSSSGTIGLKASVLAALVGLGWSERVASSALDDVIALEDTASLDMPSLLRLALARLGPQHPAAARERAGVVAEGERP